MNGLGANDLDLLRTVALFSLVAWASGLRLYLVAFALGIAGYNGWIELPAGLHVLQHPYVVAASGLMLLVEFFADKVPWLDSAWDQVHTFIRVPAGALLAAGATGDSVNALTVAAGILGGTITAGTHFAKTGGRIALNTSPEPFTNWAASLAEDAAVLGGVWLAFAHPVAFLVLFALFVAFLLWLLPKLWRFVAALFRRLRGAAKPGAT
ncbi:MAG TPA: DUF4126 domain-containing protein [Usitatibacter sp.]|nr:DUF4126 domain-containing protein [Usitatibacter sp.]